MDVTQQDLEIQTLFLSFEAKTAKLKFKNQSPIYKLFQNCFGNWRYLVSTRNKTELIRKSKVYSSGLISIGDNPFLYGSKKGQKEYFELFQLLEISLNNWSLN